MTTAEVITCPQCGAPVKNRRNRCDYCEAEILVFSLSSLDRFEREGIQKYINHYKKMLQENPNDPDANCAMGICYMELGLYDLASKFLKTAIELTPDSGESYYYYALCLLQGKKPRSLSLSEIKKIETYVRTATELDSSQAKFFILWIIIKYDYYLKSGMIINPSIDTLLLKLKTAHYDRKEAEHILKIIPVNDQDILNLIQC